MDLFQRLEHEHRTIVEMLDAYERFLGDPAADATDLPRFLVFFREFADLVHHDREETVLMPALARHGFSMTAGPSVFLREQHQRERDMLYELLRIGLKKGGCSPSDPELRATSTKFAAFQRVHIGKESELFFPEAKKQLAREADVVQEALIRFDSEHDAHGRGAWLERLVGELLVTYPAR